MFSVEPFHAASCRDPNAAIPISCIEILTS